MGAIVSSRYRLVDRYAVYDVLRPLGETIDLVIPADAEYVVFDLDRTVHLGVTIGERIGWEIVLDPELKLSEDQALEPFFSWRRPLASLARLERGVRYWGLAGLLYAATVRLGDRFDLWHRFLLRQLGPGYVERVQELLRAVLMVSQADYTPEQLARFAARAWQRWRSRLVVDASVIERVRRRCPRLKAILLSSASTRPTVEQAAAELGVDGFVSSAVDVCRQGDRELFSGPVGVPRWLRPKRPAFFSRPGAVFHNAAVNKVSLLRMKYPEVFAPGTVSVGISDNNYGEDRTWSDYFTEVVALNSRHPFSPFVAAGSPCRSISSIDALPVGGGREQVRSLAAWLGTLEARVADRPALAKLLGADAIERLERLSEQLRAARERAGRRIDEEKRQWVAAVGARLAAAVERYNAAPAPEKTAIARELDRLARRARKVRSRLWRAARESWPIEEQIERLHDRAARALVVRQPARA
ncbi:MAG: hypothetical protein D6815_09560 [Candidatus Dadabacteria bacterium]|nr:MAG: hypothetical protein D6815_09560 [Candidatus Dadabacteria bacterium]